MSLAGVGTAVNLASRIDAQTDRDPVRLRAHWAQCLTRARQGLRQLLDGAAAPRHTGSAS